ncbi:uncharacterized protein BP01DRAFT_383794 [Aspergillus saccharolyticus JOP 1030-1]|uniref:Uncharacterized protein n=1 Tax=Aspergillus saccharolyticus JOP 1030-1 TaxID=1450539 RepID=A0A319ABK4_9EURO|nr:hypothetical protein BP01DRAFT_383794 [Aspergillus saccharolyticus JOP 1030-1]PYH44302.1 hypothetical protein BP01DRAFT_383794 [Aspergillus saccharolyticus JOP 1030-1]
MKLPGINLSSLSTSLPMFLKYVCDSIVPQMYAQYHMDSTSRTASEQRESIAGSGEAHGTEASANAASSPTSQSATTTVPGSFPRSPDPYPSRSASPAAGISTVTNFNPEEWSAPIDFTPADTTVISFPDDMHTQATATARFITHIYHCHVGDLDWDKVTANLLQWCSIEQKKQRRRQQSHSIPWSSRSPCPKKRKNTPMEQLKKPPESFTTTTTPLHALIKCPPFVQLFTELHPTTFPDLSSTHAADWGRFIRYQPGGSHLFHVTQDIAEIPPLFHAAMNYVEPEYESSFDSGNAGAVAAAATPTARPAPAKNLSQFYAEHYPRRQWKWYLNRRAVWEVTVPGVQIG